MKLYSKEYYDCDQAIRDDYKMHAEKDDRLMNNPEESEKYLINNFLQNLRERIVELEGKLQQQQSINILQELTLKTAEENYVELEKKLKIAVDGLNTVKEYSGNPEGGYICRIYRYPRLRSITGTVNRALNQLKGDRNEV